MRWLLILFVLVTACLAAPALADDVRPVQIQIREQEPGVFQLDWQAPQQLPRQGIPRIVLPETCSAESDATLRAENASWVGRQRHRCPDGLAGQAITLDFPFGNPSMSTVIRAEFLDGESYAHMLAPGNDRWDIPPGSSPDAPLLAARRAVLDGVGHALTHPAHFLMVGVFALLGSAGLVGRFSAAQVVALVLGSISGLQIDVGLGEVGLALATMLLAREALRPENQRRQVAGLAVVAGLVHGLGLSGLAVAAEAGIGHSVLMALGMDATLVVLVASIGLVTARVPLRGTAYVVGVLTVAVGLSALAAGPGSSVEARSSSSRLPGLAGGTVAPGSARLAPKAPDAPLQSFVAIEAFEVRHEMLVKVADVAELLGIEGDVIEVEDQPRVQDAVRELGLAASTITIDGEPREPAEARVDFMTVDAIQGALPRMNPIPESVADAFIGFTVSHLTESTPERVELSWETFPADAEVPATMIDPETTRTESLTSASSTMTWENALAEDPVPTVEAVAVEPTMVPVPLTSIPLVLVAALLAVAALRGKRAVVASGASRVALAFAMLAAPLGDIAVALPTASADSPEAARRILAGILPNVYRAFEFRNESEAYDRLELSVTGDTLTNIYLEHQRALEMEERGGARARVEAVEVGDVSELAPNDDGGFDARATWQVGGTVTHFGHRHFRQNRYDARVTVVPVDDRWKIRTIEVLDEVRVR